LETAIRDRQDQIKLIRQTAKGPEEKSRVAPLEQEIRTLRDEIKSVRDEMHDAREASKTKPAAPKEPKPKVKGPDKKK
jgi:predicted  nucleic acid-binding Zn-ribbon protein